MICEIDRAAAVILLLSDAHDESTILWEAMLGVAIAATSPAMTGQGAGGLCRLALIARANTGATVTAITPPMIATPPAKP